MNKLLTSFIFVCLGFTAGYFAHPAIYEQLKLAGLMSHGEPGADASAESGEKKIKYWVAPMDANYRRDKPGKSPMGMDLVPVYEEEGDDEVEGVVKISPVVQNNLGVRVSTVDKGKLDRIVNTVGYVHFDEDELLHVHTRVEGWVEKLVVKATGDTVETGQALFEIYSPALLNAQEEYLHALASKNQVLITASRERLRTLGLTGGQIRQLGKTRKVQQRIAYHAGVGGFVESMNIREGMFVKPATNVMTIGRLDTVWVIAEVFERQSGWVRTGQVVDIKVAAYPGRTWNGIVDYIHPVLDEKTRTLKVRIRLDNKDGSLKPNMLAQLIIHSSFDTESLLVQREAIIRNGQMERVVKSLGDGRFQSVEVNTGSESGGYIEVLEGLEEGDSIVISAQFLIDSESSLTASFARMEEPVAEAESMDSVVPDNQAWVEGRIEEVKASEQTLSIQHQPVAAWGWPEMLMDFPATESIDLEALKPADEVRFLVQKHDDGSIEIVEMKAGGLR